MAKIAEIVIYDTEAEYLSEFVATFVDKSFTLCGIPISIIEADFLHVFSEPVKGGSGARTFSKRRAKKMRFIQSILAESMPSEIMFEQESGNIAVFCIDLDCVIYLRIRKGSGKLQLGTFFDFGREHTKMYEKQKRKCAPISEAQLQKLVV